MFKSKAKFVKTQNKKSVKEYIPKVTMMKLFLKIRMQKMKRKRINLETVRFQSLYLVYGLNRSCFLLI